MSGNVIPFAPRHARAPAASEAQRSGLNSVRGTPVSRSIGSTYSAGTPFLERTSQYQTCDCVVPIRSARCFWPPTALQARRSASFDMGAQYPNLGGRQPKNLSGTAYLIFGRQRHMKPVDKHAFGGRLKARREGLGLSQSDLATAVGMKQQSVVNIEQGIVSRPRHLREIASALSTSEDWLLWAEGPEELDENAEAVALLQAMPPAKRRAAMRFLRNLAGGKVA